MTVDELLSDKPRSVVAVIPEGKRKSLDELMLKIRIMDGSDTTININLPLSLVQSSVDNGIDFTGMMKIPSRAKIDFQKVVELAEKGLIGKLIDIKDEDMTLEVIIE